MEKPVLKFHIIFIGKCHTYIVCTDWIMEKISWNEIFRPVVPKTAGQLRDLFQHTFQGKLGDC